MNRLFLLLCSSVVMAVVRSKTPPVINPNFAVNTNEVDSNNVTIVQQRLVFDIDLRRNMMYAEGSLVHGALQQIRRCDIHPNGWFSSAGGPNPKDPSAWTCTNTTIDRKGELPQNCEYTTFWGFPDMKYAGPTEMNGIACDQWIYRSGTELFSVWVTTATAEDGSVYDVPVANGKTRSEKGGEVCTCLMQYTSHLQYNYSAQSLVTAQSLHYRFTIAALSLRNRRAITAKAYRNRFAAVVQSLRIRFLIAAHSLLNRCAFAS
jgi:hypothetical protein